MVAFEPPGIGLHADKSRQFERRQPLAFLVLGDLGIAVGTHVAHDDWNFMQSGSDRRAQSLGTEVDAVASFAIRGTHDERLQDAALSHVDGEFFEVGLGELGTRVVRVFVQACHRNKQWSPVSGTWRVRVGWGRVRCRACVRRAVQARCLHLIIDPLDRRFGRCIVQQVELDLLRLVPWHAHGGDRAEARALAIVPGQSRRFVR